MNIKVSIVIPVFNTEDYLMDCLNSIIKQTLKDIEIIVVNDGSTDQSLDIAQKMKRTDARIKIISQENKGISAARNRGLKHCKGKYVYFFDSDDLLKKDSLANCFKIAQKDKLDVLTFDAETFYDRNYKGNFKPAIFDRSDLLTVKILNEKNFFDLLIKKDCFRPTVWLHFIRRNFLFENDLKFNTEILHEDELFIPQLILFSKRIKYLKGQLLHLNQSKDLDGA